MSQWPGAQLAAAEPHGGALLSKPPKGGGTGRRVPRSQRIGRIAVLVLVLGWLILPLFAMLEFSTRGDVDPVTKQATRSLQSFAAIFSYPDLVAGITLLVIAVPEQLATSRLAGMPPVTGFYAFVAGTVLFALLGSNPQMSVGADSTIAPLFAAGVSALALLAFTATGEQRSPPGRAAP